MLREAHAIWKDGPYTGGGAISTPSGVLNNCKYNFGSLTGLSACTSPAEMLAAAASLKTNHVYPAAPLYHSWLQMFLNMDRNTLWGAAGGICRW